MSPFWIAGEPIEVELGTCRAEVLRRVSPPDSAEGFERASPQSFTWRRRSRPVAHISARWRVHTGWWGERETWRDYWEIATADGYLCHIYQDLLAGGWFLERVCE